MTLKARYAHTNLIAKDWRALAHFYQNVFGCELVPPERNYEGDLLAAGTGLPAGIALRGAHLRLPGYGDEGPTLELYQYNRLAGRPETAVNRPGFAHIAFEVDDLVAARQAVLAAGGGEVGQIVTTTIATGANVTWVYLTDPEGNIIELQTWSE